METIISYQFRDFILKFKEHKNKKQQAIFSTSEYEQDIVLENDEFIDLVLLLEEHVVDSDDDE